MTKYIKKPMVIEAFKWCKETAPQWIDDAFREGKIVYRELGDSRFLEVYVDNYDSFIIAEGEYVVKGFNGELYPIKADVFEQTYEEVD